MNAPLLPVQRYVPWLRRINGLFVFFTRGHERSIRAKWNIVVTLFCRGVDIAIGFLLVPLTLGYLDKTRYGIWVTLTSVVGWFQVMDLGLGSGLRNRLAEALACGDTAVARRYISTTYAFLGGIASSLVLIFFAASYWSNWAKIFNVPQDLAHETNVMVPVIFIFFCLLFPLKLIDTVWTADQKPSVVNVYGLITHILMLAVIYLLAKGTAPSLLKFVLGFSSIPLAVQLMVNIIAFRFTYRAIAPSLRLFDWASGKTLTSLGVQFFVMQIAYMVMFASSNLVISRLFGPAEVTPYNIAFKYFSISSMLFGIVTLPLWSAFTEAYYHKDMMWIRRVMFRMNLLWLGLAAATGIMICVSSLVYRIWINNAVTIPFRLTILVGLFNVISAWNSLYAAFLNGVGKIRLSVISNILVALVNVPAQIFFASTLGFGVEGIVTASCIVLFLAFIWAPVQFHKIIDNRATGIWAK